MNRGYATYLKESKSAVKQTLSKKRNYIKYYAWLIISLLGKLLILPASIFDLSSVKLSKNILNNKSLNIYDSFNGACRGKNFWSLFLSKLLIVLLLIAGCVIIYALGFLLSSFSQVFYVLFDDMTLKEFNDLTIFLFIPALIALVVFSILLFFRTAPISYVAFNDDKVSPQRILSKSHKAMSQGKFIVFLNGLRVFWFMLLNAIIIGLIFFVYEWLVVTFLIPDAFGIMSIQTGTLIHYINDYLFEGAIPALQVDSEMMFIIWKIAYAVEFVGIIFAIIYFLKLSAKLSLTCMVANYALYEDLVDDKYNENKVAVGVYISKAKNKKIKDLTLKDVFAIEDSEYDSSKEVLDKQPLMDLNDQDFPDEVLSDDTDETSSEVQE